MEARNKYEYGLIRAEILDTKDCIRSYVNFGIILVGAFVAGIGALFEVNGRMFVTGIFAITGTIAILIFLRILIYKFISHNRLAGYSKICSAESFLNESKLNNSNNDQNNNKEDDIVMWEIIMAEIDTAYEKISGFLEMDKLNFNFKYFELDDTTHNKTKSIKRLEENFDKFWSPNKSNTFNKPNWRYPTYIFELFSVFSFIFCIVGLFCISLSEQFASLCNNIDQNSHTYRCQITFVIISLIILFFLWKYSFQKINDLTKGKCTGSAFGWMILPFRIKVLNSIGITPEYYIPDFINSSTDSTPSTK